MATNIRSISVGDVFIQSGYGIPIHVSPKGTIFIDIIEGNGYLSNGDSTWRSGTFLTTNQYAAITGSTSPSGTNPFVTLSQISGTSSSNPYITGGTANSTSGTATLTNNTGGTITINGFFKTSDDTHLTGGSYTNSTGTLSLSNNSGSSISVNGFFKPSDDIYLTGGSYNSSSGSLSLSNSSGSSITITGFNTGTSVSIIGTTNQISGSTSGNTTTLSLVPNVHISGSLFIGGSSSIQFGDNGIGGAIQGFIGTSGDGVFRIGDSGGGGSPKLIFGSAGGTFALLKRNNAGLQVRLGDDSGYGSLSASTISATTVSSTTISTSSVSATTYLNLPTDITITGGTYSNISGSTSLTNNTGGTITISGYYTGLTVSNTQILYGSTGNTITGSTNFYWTDSANTINIGTSSSSSNGNLIIGGNGAGIGILSGGSQLEIHGSPLIFKTNANNPRFQINSNGSWQFTGGTGTNGQVLISSGATGSPYWSTFPDAITQKFLAASFSPADNTNYFFSPINLTPSTSSNQLRVIKSPPFNTMVIETQFVQNSTTNNSNEPISIYLDTYATETGTTSASTIFVGTIITDQQGIQRKIITGTTVSLSANTYYGLRYSVPTLTTNGTGIVYDVTLFLTKT